MRKTINEEVRWCVHRWSGFGRKTKKSGPKGLGKAGGVGVGIGCSVRWNGQGRPQVRGGLNEDWKEMRE